MFGFGASLAEDRGQKTDAFALLTLDRSCYRSETLRGRERIHYNARILL
ncbi:hypothetical protein LEP1GSC047_0578 [Leptospira inadai serovar Lyme str. 10]|uniref:Uncharacterized protein n=1 Tax=Leptospira inadai serovar Lyme str. 10 TaxID=1049790 RepID=V6H9R5_9LEPT|nr:hypothetical protein LEP1GSC047_0578 [Leptospira inadai serovar Lyme str. 10]